ncbi:unnamed protein product [Ophioblennius macclurei]
MSSCQPPSSDLPPDQMMMMSTVEIMEEDYPNLQQVIQTHPEPHALGSHDGSLFSPLASAQAIDLSITSEEDHCQVVCGKTPVSHGVVPNSVLARVLSEEKPSTSPGSPSKSRKSISSAKVCLEKRFNTLSVDNTKQIEIPSAVFSSILSVLQQSAKSQDAVLHPEKQKTDTVNALLVSDSHVMNLHDQVPNICGQVVALVEPELQRFILPKTCSFSFHQEMVVTKPPTSINAAQEDAAELADSMCDSVPHHVETAKAAAVGSNSAKNLRSKVKKRTEPVLSASERKKIHNMKERNRRTKIRHLCDELNRLVPLCDTTTDKVNTLQKAVAFLRFIGETYGDSLKEEFVMLSQKKEHFLKLGSSFSLGQILPEEDETHSAPLRIEQ